VDIIGLSGLITPSLEEMVRVAEEMQRLGFCQPLLIGGATTSKAHTAVKIAPAYSNNQVVYVTDASRAVGTASRLLSREHRQSFVDEIQADYIKVRDRVANRRRAELVSYADAINQRPAFDWTEYSPPQPKQSGLIGPLEVPLEALLETIDWTPFFISWDLAGKYPRILKDAKVGEQARALFADAQAMLKTLIADKSLRALAICGIWPANQVRHDDIQLFADSARCHPLATLHHLRQQQRRNADKEFQSLADFIAPLETGLADHLGGFAVCIQGADILASAWEAAGDDYNAIMVKALADRLAESLAEYLHLRVRREFWGYAASEALANDELIAEGYQGIRPAPGYPACPDHTEKHTLFQLLDAEQKIGCRLTENFAMMPAAAVSGWYFSHPESRYFGVGKIGEDQLISLAERKGMAVDELRRWLAPVMEE